MNPDQAVYYNGNAQLTSNLVRLTAAGVVESTFRTNFTGRAVKIFPYTSGNFFVVDEEFSNELVLLSSSGRVMKRFQLYNVEALVVLPDKSFVVGRYGEVRKYKVNLSLDTSFGVGGSVSTSGWVYDLELQSGKLLVAGSFNQVGDVAINDLARLNLDGSLDESFHSGQGTNWWFESITVQPDGKILLGNGYIDSYDGYYFGGRVVRLNSNGTVDGTFTTPYIGSLGNIEYANDKIIIAGYNNIRRLNLNGSNDGTFSYIGFGNYTTNIYMRVLSNKDIIVANGYNDESEYGLAKYNANGIRYTAFKPALGQAGQIRTMIYAGGKLVIGGTFFQVNGVKVKNMARLNSTGALDPTFSLEEYWGDVYEVDDFSNGDFLLRTSYGIVKVKSDGATDDFFDFDTDDFESWSVESFKVLPNDKILYDAYYPYGGIGRNNPDGSVDDTFTTGRTDVYYWSGVQDFDVQSDGKIIYGGAFDYYNGVSSNNIVRLNEDGTLDDTFDVGTGPDGSVRQITVMNGDKILAEGDFNNFGGYWMNGVVKLNGEGQVDGDFLSNLGYTISYSSYTPTIRFRNGILKFGYSQQSGTYTLVLVNDDGTVTEGVVPANIVVSSPIAAFSDSRNLYLANNIFYRSTQLRSLAKINLRAVPAVPASVAGRVDTESVTYQVFPNPTSDFIAFDTDKPARVNIVTMDGNIKVNTTVSSAEDQIDVRNLQPGRYVIRMAVDGKTKTTYFIKK
jgi:uncharacterized delta-60 repeat protein